MTRRDVFEMACRAFEDEMWPEGPAHGRGSGVWAVHKPRIAALLGLDVRLPPEPTLDAVADEADVVRAKIVLAIARGRVDAVLNGRGDPVVWQRIAEDLAEVAARLQGKTA